jgi:hypothetical protein
MQRKTLYSNHCTTRFVFRALALLVVLGSCARTPDEERIRAALDSMQKAAETRRPADVLEHVADDFTGNNGDLDRDGLAQMLRMQVLRRDGVGIAMGPIDVVIDDDRATARFEMTFSDATGRWLPSGGQTLQVVSGWRREGSRWLCYNATWSDGTRGRD